MKLTVVSPIYNEADNISVLIEGLERVLKDIDHEIIIVNDDSPDNRWTLGISLRPKYSNLKVLCRTGDPGLSAAVIDGFLAAKGEVVACIDTGLQHDPCILPEMLIALEGGADVVIGSRYVEGEGFGEWNRFRRFVSCFATKLAHVLLGMKISDPMSSYFMLRREDFLRVCGDLNTRGFKILLEIVAKMKPNAIREIPITFRPRTAGVSKLSGKVVYDYLYQLWRLSSLGKILTGRFLKYGLVGASGVLVNLGSMAVIISLLGWRNWRASALATCFAIINNYILNNLWTFRDRVRTGADAFSGMFIFGMVSLVGLTVTTGMYTAFIRGIGKVIGETNPTAVLPSWLLLLCQFGAILFGTYVNYSLNMRFTWKERADRDIDEPEI